MSTPNRPPLWEVIENCDAFIVVHGLLRRRLIGVLICALRDWLVPEEAEPTGMRPCGDTYSAQSLKRHERQRLRALLTAEADRAERGDA
jgi:hypothetical protein